MSQASSRQAAKASSAAVHRQTVQRGRAPTLQAPHTDVLAVQRSAGNKAANELLRFTKFGQTEPEPEVDPVVQSVIRSANGQPLDSGVRGAMEAQLGAGFGEVRVHADGQAAASAELLAAKAYTFGRHIVFGSGYYAPGTPSGSHLLAHELAHVVQQQRGGQSPSLVTDGPHEREATDAANAVVAGNPSVPVRGATGVGIARAPKDQDEKSRLRSMQRDDRRYDERDRKLRDEERRAERDRGKVRSSLRAEGGAAGQIDREISRRMRSMDTPEFRSRSPKNKNAAVDRITKLARDRSDLDRAAFQHGVSDITAKQQAELAEGRSQEADTQTKKEQARVSKIAGQKEKARKFNVSKTKGAANELAHISQRSVAEGGRQVTYINGVRQDKNLGLDPGAHGPRRTIDEVRQEQGQPLAGYEDKKIGLSKQILDTPSGERAHLTAARAAARAIVRQNQKGASQFPGKEIPRIADRGAPEVEEAMKEVLFGPKSRIMEYIRGTELVKRDLALYPLQAQKGKPKNAQQKGARSKPSTAGKSKKGAAPKQPPPAKPKSPPSQSTSKTAKKAGSSATASTGGAKKKTPAAGGKSTPAVKRVRPAKSSSAAAPSKGSGAAVQTLTPPKQRAAAASAKAARPTASGPAGKKAPVSVVSTAPSAAAAGKQSAPAAASQAAPTAKPVAKAKPATTAPAAAPDARAVAGPSQTAAAPLPAAAAKPVKGAIPVPKPDSAPKAAPAPAVAASPAKGKPGAIPATATPPAIKADAGPTSKSSTPAAKQPAVKAPAPAASTARRAPGPGSKGAPPRMPIKASGAKQPSAGAAAATSAMNKADTVLSAKLQYDRYRAEGMSEEEAMTRAGVTLAANLKGGPAATVVNAANAYDSAIKGGQSKAEAGATAGGTVAGGIIANKVAPAGLVGTGVQLVNTAAHVAGAPQEVQDATEGAAELVPSTIVSRTITTGARSYVNVLSGDTKAIDKQVQGMAAGEAGPWLQGYAQATGMAADLASGDSFEKALDKAAKSGKGSWADRVGSKLGDETYTFVNQDLPEAAEFAKKDFARLKKWWNGQ